MKKRILIVILTLCSTVSFGQLKVLSDGKVGVGTSSPNNLLQVAGLIKFDDTYYNTFLGSTSGASNSTGSGNTFTGYQSGYSNTTGTYNTFSGRYAGRLCLAGQHNSLLGYYAGSKTTGSCNTAIGSWAGNNNTSGTANTFMGQQTGWSNTTGGANTFIGYHTGWDNTTGNYNTYIGYGAGPNGAAYSNSAAMGYNAYATASNYIKIGNSSVTTIGGQVSWTTLSDGRFKTNVAENVKGLDFINKLRPVTYQFNTQEYDVFVRQNIPLASDSSGSAISEMPVDYSASMSVVHSGFIAQEVDSIAQLCGFSSSIVHTPANSTDPYALSYAEFVVPLVKAVQELNAIITDQNQQIQALETEIYELETRVNSNEDRISSCCPSASEVEKSEIINNSLDNDLKANQKPSLHQNTPNPFSKKTTIRYFVPENSVQSSVMVFDMQGKLVKTYLVSAKGDGNIEINANELQPGMYMYSLITGGREIDTKRMILTD